MMNISIKKFKQICCSTKKSVILFDGVCNLCNGLVEFVIDRDQDGYFVSRLYKGHSHTG